MLPERIDLSYMRKSLEASAEAQICLEYCLWLELVSSQSWIGDGLGALMNIFLAPVMALGVQA